MLLSSMLVSPPAPGLRPGTSFLFFYTHLGISSTRQTPNLSLQPGPLCLNSNQMPSVRLLPGRGPLSSCDPRMLHGFLLLWHPSLTCLQSGSRLPRLHPESSSFSPSTWSIRAIASLSAHLGFCQSLLTTESPCLPWKQPRWSCWNLTPIMSFFCPECSTLSHLRAKSKLLAGSFETETVSCPWPMPVTSPPPFSHSGHSSLSHLPQRSRPRACALLFPHSSWKILVPDNCTACLLPSFRALLKHLLLREVYPGHSIHSHSPSLPPPPASFPPAWPSPFSV